MNFELGHHCNCDCCERRRIYREKSPLLLTNSSLHDSLATRFQVYRMLFIFSLSENSSVVNMLPSRQRRRTASHFANFHPRRHPSLPSRPLLEVVQQDEETDVSFQLTRKKPKEQRARKIPKLIDNAHCMLCSLPLFPPFSTLCTLFHRFEPIFPIKQIYCRE